MLTSEKFIGTLNQKDLIFKSNNVEGLRITPGKDMKIPGQVYMDLHRPGTPGKPNMLVIDHMGKVTSLDRSGLLDVIYDPNPCGFTEKASGALIPTWGYLPGVIWTGDVCSPAKVGIGVSNPDANLHVTGTTHLNGSVGIGQTQDNLNKLSITQGNPNNNGLVINMTNPSHTLLDGVGIKTIVKYPQRKAMTVVDGTTNEDVFRVYGNGLVEAKKIHLSLNIWSDFVFDEKYKLMPLANLEKYVHEHKHLPDVPTEEEVKKEGVDVGEMDAILLEKVEELTLYLIEMNKKLEILEKENETLKAELENIRQ